MGFGKGRGGQKGGQGGHQEEGVGLSTAAVI